MGNSRKHLDVKSTVDNFAILTLRGTLSGSAGTAADPKGMSGSLVKGTELNAVVTYPSSSNPGYSFQAPTGTVCVTLPPIARYNQVYDWGVSIQPYSGTILPAQLAAGTGPLSYQVKKLASFEGSGSFFFTICQPLNATALNAGGGQTAAFSGTVPADTAHSNQPSLEWMMYLKARNTDRKV